MATTAITRTTVAVAGTSAGTYDFADYVEWISIRNRTGQTVYILFSPAGTAAAVTAADLQLADGESFTGQCAELVPHGKVAQISAWIPGGGTEASLHIRGA